MGGVFKMNIVYSKPEMNIKLFDKERLLTASGGTDVKPLSAESKAIDALKANGTEQNVTVKWAY